ncbi:hypothetical protein [Escherichia coli]|uniref:hypothetical protein n=1 Tax=Escherichia coli TaxID=562 RepID=UPI00388F4AE2
MSWSGTLRADSPGYHTELFYTQYPCAAGQHFGDGFNLDIAQTARIRKGRPALVGCEQTFQRAGE